jgi:hypothetical protein
MVLLSNPGRCGVECGARADFYSLHYERIARPLRPLQRLWVFAPRLEDHASTCAEQCTAIHAFVQVLLGYLLPTAILAALEEDSCLEYLEEHGGSPWHVGAAGLLAYSALLLPLAALVTAAAVGAVAQLAAAWRL